MAKAPKQQDIAPEARHLDGLEAEDQGETADESGPNLGRMVKEAEQEDRQNYEDPDQVEAAAWEEAEEAEEAGIGAEMSASFVVMLAENTALSIWPFLEYDTTTRDRTVELLIPVIEKHGGELPPWLAAYKEELMLGGHLALVILMTRRQIRQEDLRQEAEARRQRQAEPDQDQDQEQAAA